MGDLIKLNNLASMYAKFLEIKNKWIISNCCSKECIIMDRPIGSCIEGCGCVNLINDENIKYFVNHREGVGASNHFVRVYAENSFNKPQYCSTYSLYYFEIKCIFEGSKDLIPWMSIGLKNYRTEYYTIYHVRMDEIYHKQHFYFEAKLSTIFNNNDIFGCGLVYPSTNKMDEDFPYIFFTQNGKQIGKAVLLRKDGLSSYYPFIVLQCCSVEANFGNNLKTKPFKYDITKHLVMEESYSD
uniref:Uncharacterized protein n=1 Tax=Meloidogyne enterolobii TaxID=390850 RepID=A0A6V7TQN0_MELEN|nr:unnamed protein product [Meloidogyne enterolobii]